MDYLGIGLGTLGGAVYNEFSRGRDTDQQKALQNHSAMLQRQNAQHAFDLSKRMWDETNYGAQMKHMMDAGLNPGLMYGQGGQGGTTQTGSAPSPGGGSASGGGLTAKMMGLGLQQEMIRAQKDNIDADTNKKNEETKTLSGGNIRGSAEIQAIFKGIENTEANTTLVQTQNRLTDAIADIKEATSMADIESAYQGLSLLTAETIKAQAEGRITKESADDLIEKNRLETIGAQLNNQKILSEIGLNQSKAWEIEQMVNLNYQKLAKDVEMFNAEMARDGEKFQYDTKLRALALKVQESLGLQGLELGQRKMITDSALQIFDIASKGAPKSTTTTVEQQNYDKWGRRGERNTTTTRSNQNW